MVDGRGNQLRVLAADAWRTIINEFTIIIYEICHRF